MGKKTPLRQLISSNSSTRAKDATRATKTPDACQKTFPMDEEMTETDMTIT
jgi:hypothetical protein